LPLLANPTVAGGPPGVEIVGISRDGSVLTYSRRYGGEDEFSIRLLDVV
jgi:hypothetical protein